MSISTKKGNRKPSISIIFCTFMGCIFQHKSYKHKLIEVTNAANRLKYENSLLARYMVLKKRGKKLDSFLFENNLKSIVLWGIDNNLAKIIMDDLHDSSIGVVFCVDRNASGIHSCYDICSPEDVIFDGKKVDAIFLIEDSHDESEEKVINERGLPIVRISDVLDSM